VVITALQRVLLDIFGRLPRGLRRRIVRTVAPSYTVGAICVIERSDGHIALIRHRYRHRWGLPGGLLSRREDPARAAVREVMEEIGIGVELLGAPAVVVEPVLQRVDIVFRARLATHHPEPGDLVSHSPEITAAEWFPVDRLPDLQEETLAALEALGFEPPDDR
jgi:8-oxo-dGTP diphosphatase